MASQHLGFCIRGDDLLRVWPGDGISEDDIKSIRDSFYFGPRRTLTQDVEFAIEQLVEVAVRALSPGVNDPFTAINCVDQLGAALCTLAERRIPSSHRYDDKGNLRVVASTSSVPGIINTAFDQIRQAARADTSVTLRLLEAIATVGRHTSDSRFREALRHQTETIYHASQDGLSERCDQRDAEQRYQDALAELAG